MKRKQDSKTLRWLNGAVRGNRRYILLLVLLQSLLGVAGVANALLLQGIVDSAVAGSESRLRYYALLLLGLVLVRMSVRCLFRYLDEHTRSVLENRLKSRLYSTLLTRDYAAVSAVHSGEWMNRLTSDTAVVANGMTQIAPGFLGTAIRMTAALIALVALEPSFGGILLAAGSVLCGLTLVMRGTLKRLHSQVQASDGALRVFLTERLGSMLTIRAFSKEEPVAEQAMGYMDAHRVARMRKNAFSNLCNTGLGLVMNGSYALGAIYCGSRILRGQMTYGTLTAVLQLVSQAQSPLTSISGFLPRYYAMLASAERLMEAEEFQEDEKPDPGLDTKRFYREQFRGLELRNVSFTYRSDREGPAVLKDLDLKLNKGAYVAFTGPSGCGKSTVLKLLMCLYPLDSGTRVVLSAEGEAPLTAAWRELFAYVPQGNQLMNGTIRQVVTFGIEDGSRDEDILRALDIACAGQFVRELPGGLDTQLGERGAGLSEGQMQRIAIARAIYSDRPILLLDEATSALDEQTEKELLQKLRQMTEKTVIIVTHRSAVLEVTDQEIRFRKTEE